ncbi:MAG: hypothetical protein MHM6MM_008109 [Cercozoa sp. M6MM]
MALYDEGRIKDIHAAIQRRWNKNKPLNDKSQSRLNFRRLIPAGAADDSIQVVAAAPHVQEADQTTTQATTAVPSMSETASSSFLSANLSNVSSADSSPDAASDDDNEPITDSIAWTLAQMEKTST